MDQTKAPSKPAEGRAGIELAKLAKLANGTRTWKIHIPVDDPTQVGYVAAVELLAKVDTDLKERFG